MFKKYIEYPTCLICSEVIDTKDNAHGYRSYCRKTGYLLGFRHKHCKEPRQRTTEISFLFHNGSKFDFRLIIEFLSDKYRTSNVSCIGHSKETFLTFSINKFNNTNTRLKFIDSIKHLPYSLDKLINYLSNNYKSTQKLSQETINTLLIRY